MASSVPPATFFSTVWQGLEPLDLQFAIDEIFSKFARMVNDRFRTTELFGDC